MAHTPQFSFPAMRIIMTLQAKEKRKYDSIFSHLSKIKAVYSTLERQSETKESFIQNRLRKLKSKCNLLNFNPAYRFMFLQTALMETGIVCLYLLTR